jgi:hypothetical protein
VTTSTHAAATKTAERVAIGVLVALWAARWLVRSHHLYEWDSAQYALGAREYNVVRHQPHPPGYPLWIVLLKTTHWFIGDINTAQVVLSFVCTALATILFYRFVRTIYGAPAALLSASLLLFSPTVCFYNVVASTYPADLLISVLLAALAARLWVGEKRVGPYAVFAVAALAGVRQSGAALMAPLVGIALIRAYRGDVKRWLVGGVIGLATFAAWYLPTALMNGGVAAYQRFTSQAVRIYFSYGSVFFGASREAHLAMLHNVAVWAAVATCVAVVTYALLFLGGKLVGGSASTPSARSDPPSLRCGWCRTSFTSRSFIVPNPATWSSVFRPSSHSARGRRHRASRRSGRVCASRRCASQPRWVVQPASRRPPSSSVATTTA